MKLISIGTGQNIFEQNSAVRQRQIKYGDFFDEIHLIVFTSDNEKFQNQKIANNVFLYPSKSKIRIFYIFDFIKIIKKILKNSDKQKFILTCQDPFETGIVGVLIKLFFGLPLHIQIHTDFAGKYFKETSVLNRLRFMMAEFVLKYSDRVRVVSERIRKSIINFSKNIDVLPIKTEIRDTKYEIRKNTENKNIITVSRLEKEKNLETAIKAFKIISEKFPKATFTIVGDGSQKTSLESRVSSLGLKDRVKFVGWKDKLEEYYQNADLYISTSLYEGYGLSTVEAASYGLPLVLSDTGLVDDVFKRGDSALVCDAKDADRFAQNIIKIFENEEVAVRLSERAKISVIGHLKSLENYSEKYADSIKKTLKDFKIKNIFARIFEFKMTFFDSFVAVRYFICGIVAVTVNILSLYILTDYFGVWYLYSSVIAFLVALILAFVLQKFIVFKDITTEKLYHQFYKFSVAAVLGVITNTFLVFILVDWLRVWYVASQVIAGFFVMVQNFILYKFFIFNRQK